MMMPHIAARVFNVPLMVDAGKAAAIVAAFGGRIVDADLSVAGAEPFHHVAFENGRPSERLGKVGDRLGRLYDAKGYATYDVLQNVALIPVEGTLVHKGAFLGQSSGETSYQGLQTQVTRAARDPNVKAVAFEVDSFGGEVAGAFQTAAMIAKLSAIKPTLAILTDNALSAGYLMASAARQVVMPEDGRAGSIGVITMHVDYSQKLEKDGIKVTILAAGKHKADGNPFEALPDALATRIRGEVEATRQRFAGAVGQFRGGRLTSAQALATEAQDYRGNDAVNAGLADAVGDSHEALDAFIAEVNRTR
jgi:signal peptide peptidase SppA